MAPHRTRWLWARGFHPECIDRIVGVNTRKAWLVYTALRLLFFVVPFAVIMIIGWSWWVALIVATLVSVSLSVIFLSKPRDAASAGIYEWRTRDRTADDVVEDEAVDEAHGREQTDSDARRSGSNDES